METVNSSLQLDTTSSSIFEEFCGGRIWNEVLLLENRWPELTSCFRTTILVWVPYGFLWLASSVYIPYMLSRPRPPTLPFSCLNFTKSCFSIVLASLALIPVFKESPTDDDTIFSPSRQLSYLLQCVTYLLSVILMQVDRLTGVFTSWLLFLFWTLVFACKVVPFYTNIMLKAYEEDVLIHIIFVVIFIQFILQWFSDIPRNRGGPAATSGRCPEIMASFPSRLVFWWMTKLIFTGYRNGVKENDLWDLNPRDQSGTIVPPFEKEWSQETEAVNLEYFKSLQKSASITNKGLSIQISPHPYSETTPLVSTPKVHINGDKDRYTDMTSPDADRGVHQPSLLKILWRLYYLKLLIIILAKFISDLLQLAGPVVMSELIDVISFPSPGQEWKGVFLAASLLILSQLRSIFYQHSQYLACILSLHVRSIIIAAIYKKALYLNNESRRATSMGEIVNLMSVDCQRVSDFMLYIFMLVTVPLQIICSIVMLYVTIGPDVFVGLSVLLLLICINGYLNTVQNNLLETHLEQKDKRITLLQEALNGIKVLKLYAWENSFKDRLLEIRGNEVVCLYQMAYLTVVTGLSWTVAPFLVTLSTFATFVLTNPTAQLDANKAFVTLSLFNILRVPINLLSAIMSVTSQARVSLTRINNFLCKDDIDQENVFRDSNADAAIRVVDGTFTWDRSISPSLKDINLTIPEGTLVAIVGPVGSGKSSLVSAILGDMEKLDGNVTVKSTAAYVPQQAWIQNATLQENILFGTPVSNRKYNGVLEACALEPDLHMFTAGDQTEIGEKGINLSGGQKQRVSLARAVYSNSDIYLFDDPLSAVDSHVGKFIFDKVIGKDGLLKDKTRILVTHDVHWLPMVDQIVVMSDGVITESGSYEQLMSRDGHFAHFLRTYLVELDEEATDEFDVTKPTCDRREHIINEMTRSTNSPQVRRRHRSTGLRVLSDSYEGLVLSGSIGPEDVDPDTSGRLTNPENIRSGKVKFGVFLAYGRAAGLTSLCFAFVLLALYQSIITWSSFYLAEWTDDPRLNNVTIISEPEFAYLNTKYLKRYSLFALALIVIVAVGGFLFWTRTVKAAARLHDAMLNAMFHYPMSFFDTTPQGRILNRMSYDIETIDNKLAFAVRALVMTLNILSATFIIICINTPMFIAVMIPLLIIYYVIQSFYIPTSCQLKRIESVTRSPIYAHFSESLAGATSIRAYGAMDRFIEESKRRVDKNQVFYFAGCTANRWLAFYLDIIGTIIVFAASLFAVLKPGTSGGQLGLSLSYALQISKAMGWVVTQISELETNIVSVERVKEYSELEKEADWVLTNSRPPAAWPETGRVELRNYTTRYREGLDLVLKGLTCTVEGGQKVGIVGRTGAGKSSFTLALFRILEAAGGAIIIDDVNIADMGLHDLRSRLTILPQDPVLFAGSMRMNLDPFGKFTDDEIWRALDRSYLKTFVADSQGELNFQCGEGGENLSVGQRQLVCLARALLRHSKILVLDEATAAVDMETDSVIQKTIREAFADCTILTIAHRLNTVMDYDKILVMDAGNICEFDSPGKLLKNRGSVFYSMARDAGMVSP